MTDATARHAVTVGIATLGRGQVLAETLRELRCQIRPADRIAVCVVAGTAEAQAQGAGIDMLTCEAPGLVLQRNVIIEHALDSDILVFFDDDFFPHPTYLANLLRHFDSDPTIVMATGTTIADGVRGPGLSAHYARALLAAATPPAPAVTDVHGGYGCNMAVRMAPVRAHGLRFDPRLPLYGWQEDIDFSRQLAPHGRIVRVSDAIGVHLGVKLGRGSGLRLGYSQVANPLYIWAKRTGLPLRVPLTLISKNILMNILRAPLPEPYVDRRSRLRGNLIALADLLRGRLDPERILDL